MTKQMLTPVLGRHVLVCQKKIVLKYRKTRSQMFVGHELACYNKFNLPTVTLKTTDKAFNNILDPIVCNLFSSGTAL